MEKQNKKKLIITLLSVVLVAVLVTVGVFAWLNTTTKETNNILDFGKAEVDITETFNPNTGWDVKTVQLIVPQTENSVPVVGRVMIVPRVMDSAGNYIAAELGKLTEPVGNEMKLGDFTLVFDANWSNNWFFKDGYFYYKKVIASATPTEVLLKRVKLTNSTDLAMQERYKDAKVEVDVLANVLQAGSGAPAIEWGVKVNGTTVSPV